jgi:hypothetical protein
MVTDPEYSDYSWTPEGQCWSNARLVNGGFSGEQHAGGHFMLLEVIPNGYLTCALSVSGKKTRVQVAARVMKCFGPPKPGPKYQIDHISGDKRNNDIANLRWVTPKQNVASHIKRGGKWGVSKKNLTPAQKQSIREEYTAGATKVSLARKYKVAPITIYRVLGFGWARTYRKGHLPLVSLPKVSGVD